MQKQIDKNISLVPVVYNHKDTFVRFCEDLGRGIFLFCKFHYSILCKLDKLLLGGLRGFTDSKRPNITKWPQFRTKWAVLATLIVLSCCGTAFSEPALNPSKLADAIFKAENSAKYPYGIKSIPCDKQNTISCRQACLNTINNQLKRHSNHQCGLSYLECLRNRYAPLSDSKLNQNWLKNVRYFYDRS